MLRNVFEPWHLVVLVLVIAIVFGWKKLPDAARSLGRSMRIFKAEIDEMKGENTPSAASRDTVDGESVHRPTNSTHAASEPAAPARDTTPHATAAQPDTEAGEPSATATGTTRAPQG